MLFLHGWGATRPRFYRPWIDHLARAGNAVIYPRYQESVVDPPAEVLGNVLAGVRQAFARIAAKPRTLVVAGHSVTRRSGTGCGEVRRRSCPRPYGRPSWRPVVM